MNPTFKKKYLDIFEENSHFLGVHITMTKELGSFDGNNYFHVLDFPTTKDCRAFVENSNCPVTDHRPKYPTIAQIIIITPR